MNAQERPSEDEMPRMDDTVAAGLMGLHEALAGPLTSACEGVRTELLNRGFASVVADKMVADYWSTVLTICTAEAVAETQIRTLERAKELNARGPRFPRFGW